MRRVYLEAPDHHKIVFDILSDLQEVITNTDDPTQSKINALNKINEYRIKHQNLLKSLTTP